MKKFIINIVENPIKKENLAGLTFDEYFEVLRLKNKTFSVGDIMAISEDLKERLDFNEIEQEILNGLLPTTNNFQITLRNPDFKPIGQSLNEKLNKQILEKDSGLKELIISNLDNPEFDKFVEEQDKILSNFSFLLGGHKFSDLVKTVKEEMENPLIRRARKNLQYKEAVEKVKKSVFINLKGNFQLRKFKTINKNFISFELGSVEKLLKGKSKKHHLFEVLGINKDESISNFNELCRSLSLGIEVDYKENYAILCSLFGLIEYKEWLRSFSKYESRIFIEDIDNFSKVKEITFDSVKENLKKGYLDKKEDFIQNCLEEILNIPFQKKDWGGEINDLYTSNLTIKGQRLSTAFLLKGNGLKVNKMEIKHCGKNGDQIVRLFESPAELFVIQFVGNISEYVIKDVQLKINSLRLSGNKVWYCIIDGQDTARLLKAYNKL